MSEDVAKVQRAVKLVSPIRAAYGQPGQRPSTAQADAILLADGLLALAEAAKAVVAMDMFCICGAGPDGEPHAEDCPLGILATMLKEG